MALEPLTVTVQQAVNLTGLRHTTIWKMLREGRLHRVKVGSRTLITYQSLLKLLTPSRSRSPQAQGESLSADDSHSDHPHNEGRRHHTLGCTHGSTADCGDDRRLAAKDKKYNREQNSRVSRSQ